MHGLKITETLISQYLQFPEIAKEFAGYYDLFNKYKSDYKINKIFAGKMTQDIIERAKAANFDERLSLLGMLLDGVNESVHEVSIDEKVFKAFFSFLKQKKAAFPVTGLPASCPSEAIYHVTLMTYHIAIFVIYGFTLLGYFDFAPRAFFSSAIQSAIRISFNFAGLYG